MIVYMELLEYRTKIDTNIRLSGALRVKNIIKDLWHGWEEDKISEIDRKAVHTNIVQLIVNETDTVIRNQLVEAFYTVARADSHTTWNTVYDEVLQSMRTNTDMNHIYGGIYCFQYLCKIFRFHINDQDKKILEYLVNEGLPFLLQIAESLIIDFTQDTNNTVITKETQYIMKSILKIIAYVIRLQTPKLLLDITIMDRQMKIIFTISASPFTNDIQEQLKMINTNSDNIIDDDYSNHPSIKCKKWSFKILNEFYSKRSMYRLDPETKKEQLYAHKIWKQRYSTATYTVVMNFLHQYNLTAKPFVGKIMLIIFHILSTGVKRANAYKIYIQSNVKVIINSGIFSVLKLTNDDLRMWTDNPHGFVTQILNPLSSFIDYRYSAIELILALSKRQNDFYLMIEFIQSVCQSYKLNISSKSIDINTNTNTNTNIIEQMNIRDSIVSKDAALYILGSLHNNFKTKKDIEFIENFIIKEIFEDFILYTTPSNFINYLHNINICLPYILIARGLWFVGNFSKTKISTDIQVHTTRFACECFVSNDLATRVEAGQAIGKLISNKDMMNEQKPHLGSIFQQLLKLLDEVTSETLGMLLRNLLEHFEDIVAPYAEQLLNGLVPMFLNSIKLSKDDPTSDESNEAILTASQYLGCITNILIALEDKTEQYPHAEQLCSPIIDIVFNEQSIEFLDDVFYIIKCLTFFPKKISDYMWSKFPYIIQSLTDWASHNIERCVGTIINYFINIDEFMKYPTYVEMLLSLPNIFFVQDEDMETDAAYCAQILRAFFSYCQNGQLNSCYREMINILMTRQKTTEHYYLRQQIIDCLCALLYNNVILFLQEIQSMSLLLPFFDIWLKEISDYKSYNTISFSLHALCKLIETIPAVDMPIELRDKVPIIIEKLMECITNLRTWKETYNEEDYEDDDYNSDGSDYTTSSIEESSDDDTTTKAVLSSKNIDTNDNDIISNKNITTTDGDINDDDDDDKYLDLFDEYDLESVTTPLDLDNPYRHFLSAMEIFAQRDGMYYRDFTQSLMDPNSKAKDLVAFSRKAAIEFDREERSQAEGSGM